MLRRLGVDTGGTFTDLILLQDGRVIVHKEPSTPQDPCAAVRAGLRALGIGEADLVHGSTVGTNALLERRGARTALIATEGFADLIEIGRQARPRIYDLGPPLAEPLVPPELRFEIAERTLASGEIERTPSEADLAGLAVRLRDARVESVAVVLLHSYRNPENETKVAAALAQLGVPVSISADVLRQYREYERTVATAVNAYLRPRMQSYLEDLAGSVRGRVRVMRSNGGSLSAPAAALQPVQTVLSGPAGGVAGAMYLARRVGEDRVITFDMGGTSTDVCLLDGEPRLADDLELGGLPIRVPVLDIHTVGAGGGSLAWRDLGGALRVGPRSAGADPGPACYGRGGGVTVTDANLLLGRLLPERFLGGGMRLDVDTARAALEGFAAGLGLDPLACAAGIVRVAEATMERAIRVISLERGHDPAGFVLYTFGGAGGLHAAELARSLGIPRVRIPQHPGLFSALGMLASDVVLDLSETALRPLEEAEMPALESALQRLEGEARSALEAEGFDEASSSFRRSADLRYRGQSFELSVPFSADMRRRFDELHRNRYGHARPNRPVEVVNLRLHAAGRVDPPEMPRGEAGPADPGAALLGERPVADAAGSVRPVPVLERERLRPGMRQTGPALIVEYSSTVWLPAGTRMEVDPWGSLVLEVGG